VVVLLHATCRPWSFSLFCITKEKAVHHSASPFRQDLFFQLKTAWAWACGKTAQAIPVFHSTNRIDVTLIYQRIIILLYSLTLHYIANRHRKEHDIEKGKIRFNNICTDILVSIPVLRSLKKATSTSLTSGR
jgi:hypothetical protein